MDTTELYLETRAQLVDLAQALDGDAAAIPVPATPGWSVKDVYAHLTGVAADLTEGRRDAMGTPEWTSRQVDGRRPADLSSVCAEWTEVEPRFVAWMAAQEHPPTFVGLDVWTHQQDIVTSLGLEPDRSDLRPGFLVGAALRAFDGRLKREGAPAVRVVSTSADEIIGDGAPVATLRTDDYEVLRLLLSRRTRAQMAAEPWEGDPASVLDHLHLFPLPDSALPG